MFYKHRHVKQITVEGKGETMLATGTPEIKRMRLEANEYKMEEKAVRARKRLRVQKGKDAQNLRSICHQQRKY